VDSTTLLESLGHVADPLIEYEAALTHLLEADYPPAYGMHPLDAIILRVGAPNLFSSTLFVHDDLAHAEYVCTAVVRLINSARFLPLVAERLAQMPLQQNSDVIIVRRKAEWAGKRVFWMDINKLLALSLEHETIWRSEVFPQILHELKAQQFLVWLNDLNPLFQERSRYGTFLADLHWAWRTRQFTLLAPTTPTHYNRYIVGQTRRFMTPLYLTSNPTTA
jgi:hypothetical protein